MAILKTTQIATWYPTDGLFSPASAYAVRESGFSGVTLPGQSGDATINYGYGVDGKAVVRSIDFGNPGTPAVTIDSFLTDTRDRIMKAHLTGEIAYLQLRGKSCGTQIDNPFGNSVSVHFEATRSGDASIGDKPANRTSADITQTTPFSAIGYSVWYDGVLTKQTTTETTDANSAWFADWGKDTCGSGYAGPNRIGYIACDAGAAAIANILYTTNGGATWAATSADPFIADEHTNFIVGFQKSATQFRIIVGRTVTDGSNPAEIAYADITYGDEGTTVWTPVNVGSVNGEVITSIFVARTQAIFATTDGGEIYRSTSQGESWTEVYSGANAINAMAIDIDEDIYAAGAANTLLKSSDGGASFSVVTGPTGSDASTAIHISNNAIWLGNGTSIWYTEAKTPSSANQWTQSKDFGANHSVTTIHAKGRATGINGGSSQLLDVVVNDSTGNDGDVWKTLDGGGTWEEITNLTNSGYGIAFFSDADDNFAVIPGEDDGATAIIHKYAV